MHSVRWQGRACSRAHLQRGRVRGLAGLAVYIRRAPQSVERVRLQPNPAFQNPSPSSKTLPSRMEAQSARHQPKQPRTTQASSSPGQDDSCLQQPRLDGARSDQLFFFRGHRSVPQDATGRHSPANLEPSHAPFCPPGPSDWRSRLHGSAKWLIGAPCLTQWSPHATQSLPSSDPNEPKGSKMEPNVIAIQAKRYP